MKKCIMCGKICDDTYFCSKDCLDERKKEFDKYGC